ncbi:MAG: TVP38/TMEM64 family protein [Acetobacterium sp.]
MNLPKNNHGNRDQKNTTSKKVWKIILTVFLIGLLLGIIYYYRDDLNKLIIVLSEGSLDEVIEIIRSWGLWGPLISILLMVLQAFIAPIPAFLITGANGVIFGVFWGIVISWIGAMFGAAGTFFLARYLGVAFVRKYEKSEKLLKKVDEISSQYGTKVVFVARLLPFVSFDFISYAAGLSNMKPWSFFMATGIGMIPGTIAYVLLGNQILALSRYSAGITIVVLVGIVLGLITMKLKKMFSGRKKT